MNRRHFIGSVAAASLLRASPADVKVEIVRPRSPYEALLRDIEPGHDDFPLEKEARCRSRRISAARRPYRCATSR
jgi:hypothetical protein